MLLLILKPEGNPCRSSSSAQQPPLAAGSAVGERPPCDPKTPADTRCILTLPHLENSRGHCSGCRRCLYWGIYQHCLCFSLTQVHSHLPRPFLISQRFICLSLHVSSSSTQGSPQAPGGTQCMSKIILPTQLISPAGRKGSRQAGMLVIAQPGLETQG